MIAFSGSKQKTITTLVERKTRMLSLLKNTTKISRTVMNKITEQFSALPHIPCKTITFDQDSEFADFVSVERPLGIRIYYCEACSLWQKGSNENMMSRLRRYLPRHTSLDQITQKELDQLAEVMNNVPRKYLGSRTPKELFLKHLKRTCRTRR